MAHLDFGDGIVLLDPRAVSMEIIGEANAEAVRVRLADGRAIEWPLAWSTRLVQATPAERANARIIEDGRAIEWPDAREYLKVAPMMLAEDDDCQTEHGGNLTVDQLASCPFCRQKRPVERLPDGDSSVVRASYVSPNPLIRGITFARDTGEILYTRVSSIQTADPKVHPLDLHVPMGRRSCEKCNTMPKLEHQLRLLDKRRIRASIARRRYHEMKGSGPIWKIDRMAIYARDNGICHL